MERLLKEMTLDNGLVLRVTDESTHYYADFWNLKMVIRGHVEVASNHLQALSPSTPAEVKAKEALGSEVIYCRELTRIGVRKADKEEQIQTLLGSFEKNTLPYLRHPSFPEKLVLDHWQKMAEERTQEVEGT